MLHEILTTLYIIEIVYYNNITIDNIDQGNNRLLSFDTFIAYKN